MALYQRITAVTSETVYVLEQHSWQTEMISSDVITGEITGVYNISQWDAPVVGKNWTVNLIGGDVLETHTLDGVRCDQFNPTSSKFCGPEELDRFSSRDIYA